MSEPMLQFQDVDVFYGVIQALKQVSLEVNEGETVALIGANGAGKSTLLMSVFGQPRIRNGRSSAARISATNLPTMLPPAASRRHLRDDAFSRICL